MELIVKKALLYDFYGELLTDHQKNIYSDYILNDIGISEIAAERGISRQGVHEQIRRSESVLQKYEEKLHLVEKFLNAKELVTQIQMLTEKYKKTEDSACIDEIEKISGRILEEF